MKNSEVEQVKGVTYSLESFLGPQEGRGKGKRSRLVTLKKENMKYMQIFMDFFPTRMRNSVKY